MIIRLMIRCFRTMIKYLDNLRVSEDLIKLPRTVSGNEYIAVFIDASTRWPEAVANPDKKATTVVRVT
jgi:hypothetical protein